MLNPFRLHEDYRCHSGLNSTAKDIAKFQKIGPMKVVFNQVVFPFCKIGRLGFSKSSEFLSLLPKSEQFYIIERENKNNKEGFRLRVGGYYNENFTFFDSNADSKWMVEFQDVSFNDISLGRQKIAVTSEKYEMLIPSKVFQVIHGELLRNFACIEQGVTIYCPCNQGVSHSFPLFKLFFQKIVIKVQPLAYFYAQDEICKGMIRSTTDSFWSVNMLMLGNTDLMFQYDNGRVGMAPHRLTIEANGTINQPLQLILNSVVILLMCLFVAMILIEVIKHVTGIEHASAESFENYMLKHAEQ